MADVGEAIPRDGAIDVPDGAWTVAGAVLLVLVGVVLLALLAQVFDCSWRGG